MCIFTSICVWHRTFNCSTTSAAGCKALDLQRGRKALELHRGCKAASLQEGHCAATAADSTAHALGTYSI